ncbi:MAG TPA: NmrA family NAD(P)-binding protein [Bacteroidota bacterium]
MKTLVIGATGTVGSEVVKNLRKKGVDVRALVHTPEKAAQLPNGVEIAAGDCLKPETLPPALKDVEYVFMLFPISEHETKMGLNAVGALKKAAIRRVVYMSVQDVEKKTGIPQFESKAPIEKAIVDSGLSYTFLRPNHFFQNDFRMKDSISRRFEYSVPFGNGKISRVDTRDVAEAAVNALTQEGHAGKAYIAAGPEALSGHDIALAYAGYLGKPVQYYSPKLDLWEEEAARFMGEKMAKDVRIMYEYFQRRGFAASDRDEKQFETLLGHTPRTMLQFAKEAIEMWAQSTHNPQPSTTPPAQ